MQSEAVKEAVDYLEHRMNIFVPPTQEYIKALIKAAQSPASAVEVVTVDDAINAMILNLSRPAEGEHDPFLAAKTSFAIKAVEAIERAGWRIIKSPEGV